MLSHELRTPLTSMLGWLRLLRTGQLTPERSGRGAGGRSSATRGCQAQLIDDLLDVSRIIAGKLQLDATADRAGRRRRGGGGAIAQRRRGQGGAARCRADRGAAGRGARRSPPPAADRRRTCCHQRGQVHAARWPGPRAADRRGRPRRVLDGARTRASGIEPDVVPHVFDRFRQADSTITRRHGGLGLGLAIVRHLVELHGGSRPRQQPGAGAGRDLQRAAARRGADLPRLASRRITQTSGRR